MAHYILLMKLRQDLTKETIKKLQKIKRSLGPKAKGFVFFLTMGRYDLAWHIEAANNEDAMRVAVKFNKIASTETMPAIVLEQADMVL